MKYKYKYKITFDFGYIDELFIERWDDDEIIQSMEEFVYDLSESEDYECCNINFDSYVGDYTLSFLSTIKIDKN